jgi:hypothetical protein
VGVGLSREGGRRRWCRFNTLVLTRDGRRRDKALPKDEAEAEERWHWREKREETMLVGLTQILLSRKIKKIHTVDSVAINGQ